MQDIDSVIAQLKKLQAENEHRPLTAMEEALKKSLMTKLDAFLKVNNTK